RRFSRRHGISAPVLARHDTRTRTGPGRSRRRHHPVANALRALDALGVGSLIRSRGLTQAAGGIRSSSGRWLARTDTAALAARFGDGIVVLERGDLLSALVDACTDADMHTSTEVVGVDADGTVRYTTPSGAD